LKFSRVGQLKIRRGETDFSYLLSLMSEFNKVKFLKHENIREMGGYVGSAPAFYGMQLSGFEPRLLPKVQKRFISMQ
jgi:hypothetical protein